MSFERAGTTVEYNATSSSLTVPTGTVAGETGLFFFTGSTAAPSSLTLSKSGVTFTTIKTTTLATNSWYAIFSATGLVAGDTVDITAGSTALTVATHTYWSDTFSTLGTGFVRSGSSNTCTAPAMTCSAGQRVLLLATERTTANGTSVTSVVNSNGRTVTERLYFQTDTGSDSSAYVGEFTETGTDTGTTTITYSGGSGNGSAIHLLIEAAAAVDVTLTGVAAGSTTGAPTGAATISSTTDDITLSGQPAGVTVGTVAGALVLTTNIDDAGSATGAITGSPAGS